MDLEKQILGFKLKLANLKRVKTAYQNLRNLLDSNIRYQNALSRENRVMQRALRNIADTSNSESEYAKTVLRGLGLYAG